MHLIITKNTTQSQITNRRQKGKEKQLKHLITITLLHINNTIIIISLFTLSLNKSVLHIVHDLKCDYGIMCVQVEIEIGPLLHARLSISKYVHILQQSRGDVRAIYLFYFDFGK